MTTNILSVGIILMMLVFTVSVLKKTYALPVVDKILKHFYPHNHVEPGFPVQQQFNNHLNHIFATLKALASSLYLAFNPVQFISRIGNFLCNFGVHDQLKPYEIRRVKIFNYCNGVGFLSAVIRLLYLRFFATTDYTAGVLAINALPMVVCMAMSVCLTLRSFKAAILIFFSCFPPVLAAMIFFTNDTGLEIYLIVFVLLTFFFLHRIKQIITSFCWILLCFLLVILSGSQSPAFANDFTLTVINYSTAFVFLFISLYFIKFEVWKYEKSIRKQKKELQQLNVVKDKVFSVISHDMRTPITSAIMLMRALEDEAYSQTEFKELLPQLRSSMEETGDLLSNLLVWARNQIEHTVICVSDISLAAVAAQSIQSFR